jgi:hypothetical protein
MNVNNSFDSMTSSSLVLEMLRLKRIDNEFHWTPEGFTAGKGKAYRPEQLEILKTFRFEGASDPSDSEILYIIRAEDGLIGYSQDVYGANTGHEDEQGYDNFIRQIRVAGHENEVLFEL